MISNDWGTISLPPKGSVPNNGFPIGFDKYYIKYNNTYWIVLKNEVDLNSVKVTLNASNKFIANQRVTYKYSTTGGNSWSEYTDTIELNNYTGFNSITESTIDLYDSTFSNLIRQKDILGDGIVGNPTEVSMVNGTTEVLDNYVGVNSQLVVDVQKKQLRIMDGITKGGTVVGGTGTTGGQVDLSGYATTSYVNTELAKKSNETHTHTELHAHSNKSVLDGITTTKVNEWNAKSNFSGDYNDLINKPTTTPEYTLPVASASTLGGVKIGSGINVTNGVISVSASGNSSWIGAKSVKDFGAKGDGVSDDTSAIQQAIYWSNDNTKSVYFPSGKYRVTQTLYLKDFCSFIGDGNTPYGKDIYGPGNVSDVVIQCLALTVFKGYNATETSLHQTQISLKGINFQQGDPTDSNMLNSIFFYKLQLNNSDIRHCLFRGFGIWLMGAMFMLTFIERNIFMEMRKYFMQSLSIPSIGNTAGIIDSKVNNNYISGSQSGLVDNIAFFMNYPAFSEIRGNFIDFWKWGMDIWQGEATSISDNEFQYCSKGIRVSGANSMNIQANRFGKMKYSEHRSAFKNDVSRWGMVWHGIDLEDSLTGCVATNNIGSTIDTLIRMRATTYSRMFVNANMSSSGTIVDTSISNDTTKKIFIQELR